MTDGGRRRNRSLVFLCQCICICRPLYLYFSVFEVLHLYGDSRYCVVSGHNGRFGAGLSHRYRSDKWMRESCYPLCGWLSSRWFYPSDKTIQYISTVFFLPSYILRCNYSFNKLPEEIFAATEKVCQSYRLRI